MPASQPNKDFPKKVWLARVADVAGAPGEKLTFLQTQDAASSFEKAGARCPVMAYEVQRYFPAQHMEGLVEALAPFAELADEVDRLGRGDESTCPHRLKAGDLRKARAAVSNARSLLEVKG